MQKSSGVKPRRRLTFAKTAQLSREMNAFFSVYVPFLCRSEHPSIYTVFAGGDDFSFIGPREKTQAFAAVLRERFADFAARNPEVHFSAGFTVAKPGIPVRALSDAAEAALEAAKASGRNAVTIYGLTFPWDKWEELHRIYKEEWTPVHPKVLDYRSIYRPETGEMLARARAAGLRTAVASSTKYEVVMEVMREVGIDSQLDLVMSGEFFARSKPDPAIYLKTCEMLSVAPEDCLVIEDSTVGIRAAHDAGAEVAALIDDRYGFDRRLADHEISRISELWQYL